MYIEVNYNYKVSLLQGLTKTQGQGNVRQVQGLNQIQGITNIYLYCNMSLSISFSHVIYIYTDVHIETNIDHIETGHYGLISKNGQNGHLGMAQYGDKIWLIFISM